MLDQGIPTGGKHSVPLANILLCFILVHELQKDNEFSHLFRTNVKLWKRFIDDGSGIYKGVITDFMYWFRLLQSIFNKYNLELTCDTDSHTVNGNNEFEEKDVKGITFLDLDVFKSDGTIHTKEHRKETSSNAYLNFESAHPRHTFPGIIKSQMYRIRRLCSRDIDYNQAILDLQNRCINSGYNVNLINSILGQAKDIRRTLEYSSVHAQASNKEDLRLVILSGTTYENEFKNFAKHLNSLLRKIRFQIVTSTGPTLGRLIFNNNNKGLCFTESCAENCFVCRNGIQGKTGHILSTVTGFKYNVDKNLNCNDGGIYIVIAGGSGQYTGKTIHFGIRGKEHFQPSKLTSVYQHMQECNRCSQVKDFSVTFVESYQARGKYSLSEREFLWNNRMKGVINAHKTLKSD